MILLRFVLSDLQWSNQLREAHLRNFNKSSYLMTYQEVGIFFSRIRFFPLNESSQLSPQH